MFPCLFLQVDITLDLGNNFFSKEWSALYSCPEQWGVSVPGVFQGCGDVALGDVVSGHGGVGWGSWKSFPTPIL